MESPTLQEARSAHYRAFWHLLAAFLLGAWTLFVPGKAWWNLVLMLVYFAIVAFFFVRSMQAWKSWVRANGGSWFRRD